MRNKGMDDVNAMETTSTYKRSTITMKRNQNRDIYTALLIVLITGRESTIVWK